MQLLPKAQTRKEAKAAHPRLGQINFVNCLPVLLPLTSGRVSIDAEITEDTPSNLNAGYSTGELDLGAMSSYFYLANEKQLTLVPDISISAKQEVGSVLFFAKNSLKEGCRIVVPASSATSVALLRLYLAIVHGVHPELVTDAKPDLDAQGIDAVLVIGDRALTVDSQWSPKSQRVDLGQWWMTNYKTPMVFGVWAARKDWITENESRFQDICQKLKTARDLGLSELFDNVLDQSELRTSLSRERLRRYFTEELDYCLSPDHLEGLRIFKELLQANSLL